MQPTVRIEGVDSLKAQLARLADSLSDRAISPDLLDQAQKVADRARSKAPLGPTGNLKRSIHAKMMPAKGGYPPVAIAAVDRKIAPHGHLVEFGTVKMSARPFFRPAIAEVLPRAFGALKDSFKRKIESIL